MADSRPEGRTLGPLGAGRAMGEGVVNQIVNGVVRELDVNAIVGQVDIDDLLTRIDIDALLERIDMDALLERVDVDGIIKRIDLQALMADIGLQDIVRQSTGALASDSVKLVRVGLYGEGLQKWGVLLLFQQKIFAIALPALGTIRGILKIILTFFTSSTQYSVFTVGLSDGRQYIQLRMVVNIN